MTEELLNPEGVIGAREVVDGEERSRLHPYTARPRQRSQKLGKLSMPFLGPDRAAEERERVRLSMLES